MGSKGEATVKGNAKKGGSGVKLKRNVLKKELRLVKGLCVSCAEKGAFTYARV